MTGATFFFIGALKSRFVNRGWLRFSGVETLFVGGSAAILAYCAGILLKGIG